MAVYVLTYNIGNTSIQSGIAEEVDRTPWARISETSYAIKTDESPSDIYSRFSEYLDETDSFYVFMIETSYCGQGSQDVEDWLAESLSG